MMKTIKFDYFANGRYAGTMEIPSSTILASTDPDRTFRESVLSKCPTLKNDKITISVYEC